MKSKDVKTPRGRWGVLTVAAAATFMSALDGSIVSVALPKMAGDLQIGTAAVTWIVSLYLIVVSVFTLLFGRLGDLKGQNRVFRFGLLVFTGGSLLCGMMRTFVLLAAARSLQAVGASAIMANSQGIITRTFPSEERGRALGINGSSVALGMLAGPALGGLILSVAEWKYLFWINVPIGICVYFASLHFSGAADTPKDEKLDLRGFFLFALAAVPFFAALELGPGVGWESPGIIAGFAVSVVFAIWFCRAERQSKYPLLDFQIFRNRWFTASIFCAFTSFVAVASSNIILPFYLQNVRAMGPAEAGMYLTIYPLVLAASAPVSGSLSDRLGPGVLTFAGLVLTAAGLLLMAGLGEKTSRPVLGLFIGVMSLGNGLFQAPNNSLVMSMLPHEKLGVGGSVNSLVRNMGMAVGTALSTAVLYGVMSACLGRRVTGFVSGRSDVFLAGMRAAYGMAASICAAGAAVTAVRLFHERRGKKDG